MQNALMKSSFELLATVDWEDVSIRLAAYVGYRSRRWAIPADVEDVVSETLCRIIDEEYKSWDPEALEHRRALGSAAVRIEERDEERVFAMLRARIAADEVLGRVLDHYADGIEKTRHIAESLGLSAPEVHNAKRRLLGHLEAVRAELESEVSDA